MRSGRGSSYCFLTGRRSGGRWRDRREVIDAFVTGKFQTGAQWGPPATRLIVRVLSRAGDARH